MLFKKSSLGVLSFAFDPTDLKAAKTEQASHPLQERVSADLLEMIEKSESWEAEPATSSKEKTPER